MGGKYGEKTITVKGQNTPWPEDARANPYLSESFENFNERANSVKPIDAHSKGIGGMALHAKK
jgi:WD40 repeat protein